MRPSVSIWLGSPSPRGNREMKGSFRVRLSAEAIPVLHGAHVVVHHGHGIPAEHNCHPAPGRAQPFPSDSSFIQSHSPFWGLELGWPCARTLL